MQVDVSQNQVFRSSRMKWFFIFLGSALFTAGGLLVLTTGPDEMLKLILCTLFFGLCSVASFIPLIKPGKLTLTHEGFEQELFFRKTTYAWRDVSEFSVAKGYKVHAVGFTRREDLDKYTAQLSAIIAGTPAYLGDKFGMNPKALADIMNAYRMAALRPVHTPKSSLFNRLGTVMTPETL